MRILVVAMISCGALAASTVAPAAGPQRPAGVDWGAGHFSGQHALRAWLSRRGVDYHDWVLKHPRGLYLMTHTIDVSSREGQSTTPTTSAGGVSTVPTDHAAPSSTVLADSSRSGMHSTGILAMFAGAGVLLLLAAIPLGSFGGALPDRLPFPLGWARTALALVAASLAVGASIAVAL